MTSKRISRTAIILSGVAMLSLSATAHAGFEWKGPLEPPPSQTAAPAPGMEDGNMNDLAPVTAAPVDGAASAPAPAAAPAPEATPVAAASGDVLTGFASDVPLVMALQQIVPPGYQYSFGSGVDAGMQVSWQGGKPWQGVLTEMLANHGLGYQLQNNTVVVGAAQSMPAPASAPAQTGAADNMMTPMPGDAQASAAPASGGSAPLNIVSQPPAADGSVPAPTTAAAPVAESPAAPAPKQETVDIRRDKPAKPKTLFDRIFHRDGTSTVKAETKPINNLDPSPVKSSSSGAKVAAADIPAPKPAASMTDAPPAATAAPAATPVSAMAAVPAASSWQGGKGQTLRDVLKAWSDKAGVDLYWSIDYDYRLSEDVTLNGTYDEAVGSLLDKFNTVRPQPYGQLHQGGQGPRVLVIKSYDLAQ